MTNVNKIYYIYINEDKNPPKGFVNPYRIQYKESFVYVS